MIIELGNHAPAHVTKRPDPNRPGHEIETLHKITDGIPRVTRITIPEGDDSGLGGYTHRPGAVSVDDFRTHMMERCVAEMDPELRGVTRLPDSEILLSALHPIEGAMTRHATEKPAWVKVYPTPAPEYSDDYKGPRAKPHSAKVAADVQSFLAEYWRTQEAEDYFGETDLDALTIKKEMTHWTDAGLPGILPTAAELPDLEALYTNNGRVISNVNDGGGAAGTIGVGITTGTDATHLGVSGNPGSYTGYRIIVYSTSSNNLVWGNITATSSSLVTVDRWYTFATPGGAAGTTPTTPWAFAIPDGGFVSTWFVGLATGANAAAATDTTLSTNGNAEITTGGGGLIRKIAPYAQTSGVASRAFTLTPVYTANGSDSLPATVTTIGVFCSMVVGTTGTMKFETALNVSATLSASGDQLTVTETVTGS